MSIGLLLAFAQLAGAQVDLQLEAVTRSYPLSGSLTSELGYGIPIWGSPSTGNTTSRSPWYGYIRPSLKLATAGTYNAGQVSIDLFPLSFIGIKAGVGAWQTTDDYKAFDCTQIQCKGKFNHQFIEAKVGFVAGPLFLLARGKIEDFQQSPLQQNDFIEPTLGMVAEKEGDRVRSATGILGGNINDRWSLAALWSEGTMEKRKGFSRTQMLTVNWKADSVTILLGAGAFESSEKSQGATFAGLLRWEIWPSIELF